MEQPLRRVALLDRAMCENCRFMQKARLHTAYRVVNVVRCARRDCDNWETSTMALSEGVLDLNGIAEDHAEAALARTDGPIGRCGRARSCQARIGVIGCCRNLLKICWLRCRCLVAGRSWRRRSGCAD